MAPAQPPGGGAPPFNPAMIGNLLSAVLQRTIGGGTRGVSAWGPELVEENVGRVPGGRFPGVRSLGCKR